MRIKCWKVHEIYTFTSYLGNYKIHQIKVVAYFLSVGLIDMFFFTRKLERITPAIVKLVKSETQFSEYWPDVWRKDRPTDA